MVEALFSLFSGDLRLDVQPGDQGSSHFVTWVREAAGDWRAGASEPNYPAAFLIPSNQWIKDTTGYLAGKSAAYHWQSTIWPQAGGFWIDTVVVAEQDIEINPAMILWIGKLDGMDDRQGHIWRQTVLRAPTINQQGVGGNDLPACYLYDHATQLETICFYPSDSFAWTEQRFLDFSMREIMAYRPDARWGLGAMLNGPTSTITLCQGTHHFYWWFTQRTRASVPSPWEAQTALLDVLTPLINGVPYPLETHPEARWHPMAKGTLADLEHEACWIDIEGQRGLRAYVRGSSSVGRDEAKGFELMTQLDVLWPLMLWQQTLDPADPARAAAQPIIDQLRNTLPVFHRLAAHFIANNYPPRQGDTFMDTWYFLENALIKWPWVAFLSQDQQLKDLFFDALTGATLLAHNTNYLFPLFADAADWKARHSILNVSVGGLYAAGHVIAYQMDGQAVHLNEASAALRTMHQLPPHQLTHEPQQLSFAAASAAFLSKKYPDQPWAELAADFLRLQLRMGYWRSDPAVSYYNPTGMFQACASLCYPAFKENVECLIAWPELLRQSIGPRQLMVTFAGLQQQHNHAFFDFFLPDSLRSGPCPYIPYEDLATSEFRHTAALGKELYGAGEVFWSALLFDTLGQVDDPEILCLSLDVPCLELKPVPPQSERSYLLYNPTNCERSVTFNNSVEFTLLPRSIRELRFTQGVPHGI